MRRPCGPAARRRTSHALALGLLSLSAACVPGASGECASDAQCSGGPAGSFCAAGICQGPTLGSLVIPAGPFARTSTATIEVQLQRVHGGAANATAQLIASGANIMGAHNPDGSLRIDAPLGFAPAGQEGEVPFQVIVTDDLGHQTSLPGSVLVDDEAPRMRIDPASLPSAATLRGRTIALRVLLTDEAPSTLQFSLGAGVAQPATQQPDGSFVALLDTAQAAPGASSLAVQLLAEDSLGNRAQQSLSLPLTRLRWRSSSPSSDPIVGIAINLSSVMATTFSGYFVSVDRADGTRTQHALTGLSPSGNLVVDESAAYTALTDGRVCKLGFDGSVLWCCASFGGVSGALSVGLLPSAQAGSAPVSTVLATSAGNTGRFFAMRDGASGSCDWQASSQVATFFEDSPAIGPDGLVYATATEALAVGLFDGLAWTSQPFSLSENPIGQPAFANAAPGSAGQRVLVGTTAGFLDALSFPQPADAGVLPGAPGALFDAQVSLASRPASTPALAEDGAAIVSTIDSRLAAIAPDGSLLWSAPLGSPPSAAPTAGAGGVIYAPGSDGTLTAYGLDGGVLWSFSAGASIVAPASPGCDGAIYLGTSTGDILSIVADAPGLANSPWPREGHDIRGSGDARRPLRDVDGGCLE